MWLGRHRLSSLALNVCSKSRHQIRKSILPGTGIPDGARDSPVRPAARPAHSRARREPLQERALEPFAAPVTPAHGSRCRRSEKYHNTMGHLAFRCARRQRERM